MVKNRRNAQRLGWLAAALAAAAAAENGVVDPTGRVNLVGGLAERAGGRYGCLDGDGDHGTARLGGERACS